MLELKREQAKVIGVVYYRPPDQEEERDQAL